MITEITETNKMAIINKTFCMSKGKGMLGSLMSIPILVKTQNEEQLQEIIYRIKFREERYKYKKNYNIDFIEICNRMTS